MKQKNYNSLTIIILAVTGLVWVCFLIVFLNPQSGINLFAPPTLPPTVSVPSATSTPLRLPPSWTPGSGPTLLETVSMLPTSTQPPTETIVIRSSFTVTPTWTNTPTITPTITNTPTITPTPSRSPTQNFTATALSRIATSIAQTETAQ